MYWVYTDINIILKKIITQTQRILIDGSIIVAEEFLKTDKRFFIDTINFILVGYRLKTVCYFFWLESVLKKKLLISFPCYTQVALEHHSRTDNRTRSEAVQEYERL